MIETEEKEKNELCILAQSQKCLLFYQLSIHQKHCMHMSMHESTR